MVKLWLIFILFTGNIVLAAILAKPDKTKMNDAETLNLVINIKNHSDAANIDLSGLNQDFIVVSKSQSSSFTSINGRNSSEFTWNIVLEPKRVGELTIPAFVIGNETSESIKIQVESVADQDFSKNPVFLTANVDNPQPMVQEQVLYTINLYSQFNIGPTNLKFSPSIAEAIVKPLINDQGSKQVEYNGKGHWLKQYRFAIYPQKTGKIIIPRIKNSVVLSRGNQNSNLLLFASGIELDVTPLDASYPPNTFWLPAQKVTLSSDFSDPKKMQVGEVSVREITLEVLGQSVNQLPELSPSKNDAFEQYLDEKQASEVALKNNIQSTIKQKILIIPNQFGTQTLPEMSISWFDTQEKKMKTSVLPALQVYVLPQNKPNSMTAPNSMPTSPMPENEKTNMTTQPVLNLSNQWWMIISAVFFSLWVLTLIWFLMPNRTRVEKPIKLEQKPEKFYLQAIRQHAKNNNAQQTKIALDEWLKNTHSNFISINEFARKSVNQDFTDQLLALQQSLYHNKSMAWDGSGFYTAFTKAIQHQNQPVKDQLIPELYPSHRATQ